jgi:hypothetical protein
MRGEFNFESLDELVGELIKKSVIERRAIGRFRAAVIISMRLARNYERDEHGISTSNRRAAREREILDEAIWKLKASKIPSPMVAALERRSTLLMGYRAFLPAYNWRRADPFKSAFINNLAVYWERLTGKVPPKSDKGDFAEFVSAAFAAVHLKNEGAGRYVRSILTSGVVGRAGRFRPPN